MINEYLPEYRSFKVVNYVPYLLCCSFIIRNLYAELTVSLSRETQLTKIKLVSTKYLYANNERK